MPYILGITALIWEATKDRCNLDMGYEFTITVLDIADRAALCAGCSKSWYPGNRDIADQRQPRQVITRVSSTSVWF